ncbi:MAG TPA: protein kinase [Pirellulaceae bacterium]|nr:protein kinase [Pirellulaceae bacterium]
MTEREIFAAALHKGDAADRALFLDTACRGDTPLRQRVESLLEEHHQLGSFMEVSSFEVTLDQPLNEQPGMKIGPYKLLQQIGEGGFGVVFMAEQIEPVRRKVALKVIKPGMDTRQVIARFEAERQALAVMDHPNIAKVLDAGTIPLRMADCGLRIDEESSASNPQSEIRNPQSVGRPYFVMELVRGIPITQYCDENNLPVRERLELFASVCQAIQHAHTKGIIHRDIKPTNVLVTQQDGEPVVKVIDFGVAKAMGQQLTEKTLFTEFAQMIGTPLYMSPEQAAMSGTDIDTRSDIYSLGVLLYELLTGSTPVSKEQFKQAAFDEIRRIIREQEPQKPSTRISGSGTLASIAAQRLIEPARLSKLVRGELDWIVMKCLEKDRNRRYETASGLAKDVERYLADEPVLACPPSILYRFRKLARRHKGALASVSVVAVAALLALAALAVSTVLVWRANQELTESLGRERQSLAREREEANFHRITLADRELSSDNLARTLKLLEACPEDLRQWEWRYLMRLCRVEPLVIQDNTEFNAVAFSPDGERLASAGGDGMVKIWNSKTGDLLQTFRAHSGSVVCVVFHPHGNHLATAGADLQVKVWDLTTGQELFRRPCHAVRSLGGAYTVAFRPPDGRLLAAGNEGVVTLWDWENDRPSNPWQEYELHALPVAFSPDGRRLATGGAAQQLQRLWDVETGELLRTLPAHTLPVSALAFSPDGGRLASASLDRSVAVYDTTSGELLSTFLHTGNVLCVAFSPSGRRLASAGEDKIVRVWDAATGREVLGLRGHAEECKCLAFSPDPEGWRLASASPDGTIRIWDASPLRANEGQESLTFTEHTDELRSVAFSPDGRKIVSAGHGGLAKVWDPATGQVSLDHPAHKIMTWSVAWQPPDGLRIASAGADGPRHAVKIWDAESGRGIFEFKTRDLYGSSEPEFAAPDAVPYFAVAFSPDGWRLVTGKQNGDVEVWNAETGAKVHKLGKHAKEIRGLVFSPEKDGRWLASASGDGKVNIWDAKRLDQTQKEPHREFQGRVPGPCLNVAFSPDGQRLAAGGKKNTIIIWEVETGRELQTLQGHNGEVYTVAFSPADDGRWVASGGEDSAVKIWDSRAGTLVRNFRGHTGLVSSLAFSPDGRRLVSGSRDKTVKVWDMMPGSDSQVPSSNSNVPGDNSIQLD